MTLVRIAVLLCACFTAISAACGAQSLSTASKGAEISAYGGYAPGSLDYGPYTRKGFSAGAEFTLFPRFFLKPSLEARGNVLSGIGATEKTALSGPPAQPVFRTSANLYAYRQSAPDSFYVPRAIDEPNVPVPTSARPYRLADRSLRPLRTRRAGVVSPVVRKFSPYRSNQ